MQTQTDSPEEKKRREEKIPGAQPTCLVLRGKIRALMDSFNVWRKVVVVHMFIFFHAGKV